MIWKRYKGRKLKPGDAHWDDGTWVVEFSLRGHYVKESIPEAKGRRQAEEAETAMRQAIFDRRFNKASGTTKLADFIKQHFEPWAKENNRSWRDDRQRARELALFFRGRNIRDIQPLNVEKFKADLRRRRTQYGTVMSPATVNRYLHVASKVFSLAAQNGLIDSNPVSKVSKLREPPPRERWLTGDEEEALLTELRKEGAHMEAFALLPLYAGFRAGELLSRRRRHFDLTEKLVEIDDTKNGRDRRVPLNSRVVEALAPLLEGMPEDALVFGPAYTGRRRRQMLYRFVAACSVAGVRGFHYHDLRHSFATRLRAAGVHEYDIADLLGHSTTPGDSRSTKVTRGYAHGVPSRLREAVEAICDSNVVEFRRKEAAG